MDLMFLTLLLPFLVIFDRYNTIITLNILFQVVSTNKPASRSYSPMANFSLPTFCAAEWGLIIENVSCEAHVFSTIQEITLPVRKLGGCTIVMCLANGQDMPMCHTLAGQ